MIVTGLQKIVAVTTNNNKQQTTIKLYKQNQRVEKN